MLCFFDNLLVLRSGLDPYNGDLMMAALRVVSFDGLSGDTPLFG